MLKRSKGCSFICSAQLKFDSYRGFYEICRFDGECCAERSYPIRNFAGNLDQIGSTFNVIPSGA